MHKLIIKFFARYQQQMIIYISDDNMESGHSDIRNKTSCDNQPHSINWQQTENGVENLMIIIKVSVSFCPVFYAKNGTNIPSLD
jgi:hypothetical protein